jgi:putative oxidoreductase
MAVVFVYDAILLIRAPAANAAYLEQFGVPALLVYPAMILEFFGGLLVAIGLFTRLAALALAAFCLATALLFHHKFLASGEVIQFGKDLGLAGGYMLLVLEGAGRLSLAHVMRPMAGAAPERAQPVVSGPS